jgi:hypothetical protein
MEHPSVANESDSQESLTKSIARSHKFVHSAVLLALGAYMVWFWLVNGRSIADQPETWGQFGDYVGGVLNPLVAYFAFYWLTRSVSLQKKELEETRQALEESSKSQERQANSANSSARIAALSALINSIMGEVQIQRLQIQFLLDQASEHPAGAARKLDGTVVSAKELPEFLAVLNQRISDRMTERYAYEEELRKV